MAFSETLAGKTFTEASFEGNAYADETDGFPAALQKIVEHVAGFGISASTTELTIGTGSKSVSVDADKPFALGMYVLIAETADPTTNWMYGQITSWDAETGAMDVDVVLTNGSGTISAWTVSIAGARGATGATGANGEVLFEDLQDRSSVHATDTGSADAYAIALSPAISAYAAGQVFSFVAGASNTGASTLDVNSLGAKTIKDFDGSTDLASGDIQAGQLVVVGYDGTNFQILSASALGTAGIKDGAITESKLASGFIYNTLTYSGTATGALAENKVNIVNSDGTFSAVSYSYDALSQVQAPDNTGNTTASASRDSVLVHITGNFYVAVWSLNSSADIKAMVGELQSDGSMIWGSEQNASTGAGDVRQLGGCSDGTVVVISFNDAGTNSGLVAGTVNTGAKTISFGSAVQADNGVSASSLVPVVFEDAYNTFCLAYIVSSTLYMRRYTVSGTTLTAAASEFAITSTNRGNYQDIAWDGSVMCVYHGTTASSNGTAITLVTPSSSSAQTVSADQVVATYGNNPRWIAYLSTPDAFVCSEGGSTMFALTHNGSTITKGGEISGGAVQRGIGVSDAVAVIDSPNTSTTTVQMYEVSGTTLSANSEDTVGAVGTRPMIASDGTKFVSIGLDSGSDLDYATYELTSTASNWVGINVADVSDSATFVNYLKGGFIPISGLDAGDKYYVDKSDGSLTKTANELLVGTAFSDGIHTG